MKPVSNAKRIVIKIGSALLVDAESGLRSHWLDGIAADIADLRASGKQVLVVSSGAIALGRSVLSLPARPLKLDESQAAAAVGQIALARGWSAALERHGLTAGQILLTLNDTEGRDSRRSYLNARDTIERLLTFGSVPVVNENDTIATSEIRYGDNDRLAARVATMMQADLLILLSDVDGLYTAPPARDPNARLLTDVSEINAEIEAMAGVSSSATARGGMITKIEAGKIATRAGTDMIITSGKRDRPISTLTDGAPSTVFHAAKGQRKARKTWLAGQLETRGRIWIDAGAERALRRGKSLLPAGVRKIEGQFDRGDAIAIIAPDGHTVAHGLATYDAEDATLIAGHKSEAIADVLGYDGRSTMVHRDDMVLVDESAKDKTHTETAGSEQC